MTELNSIICENSLQSFFFEKLLKLNNQMTFRIPKEMIYYSSIVMDKMSFSENYFQIQDGKVKEKILAFKLLEVEGKSMQQQKRAYREIAEMSLMLCGYFHSSVNLKLVDHSYYQMIGEACYRKLNILVNTFLDIDSFYEKLALNFLNVSNLLSVMASEFNTKQDLDKSYLIKAS